MRLELPNCLKAYMLCEMGEEEKAGDVIAKIKRKGVVELSSWSKLFWAKLLYLKSV